MRGVSGPFSSIFFRFFIGFSSYLAPKSGGLLGFLGRGQAREVMKEMQKGEEVEREEEEDDEDLATSVERWMKEQADALP